MSHTRKIGVNIQGRYICGECTRREGFSILWPCGPSEYQRGRNDAAKAVNAVMRFGEFGSTLLAAARGDSEQ